MKRFPDCTIFTMPQRSEVWHAIRSDKLTGSAMGAWLAERPEPRATVDDLKAILDQQGIAYKKSAPKGEILALVPPEFVPPPTLTKMSTDARDKAINRVLGSMSGCEIPDEWEVDPNGPPPRNRSLWAVWNGIRLEPENREIFMRETGLEIEEIGFCRHKSKASGCSPDGLIVGKNEGAEFKSPLPETHISYLRAGILPDDYKFQVHGCMAVTGADAWWFQSYCPRLPIFRLRIDRDDLTERMTKGLTEFAELLEAERKRLLDMTNADPARQPCNSQ